MGLTFLVVAIGLAAGLAVGMALAARGDREVLAAARGRAERILAEAREATGLTRREAEATARGEVEELRALAERERRLLAEEIQHLEHRLAKQEERDAELEAALGGREATLAEREAQLQRASEEARQVRQDAKDQKREQRRVLEARAGRSAEQLKDEMAEQMIEDSRSRCADRLRNLEATGSDEFARQAKRVMGIAMQRYTGHSMRERTSTTMQLPEGAAERLRSEDGAAYLALLAQHSGVNLLLSDAGDTLRLDSSDGVNRELCRRALTRFLGEDRVRDPERLVRSIEGDLGREIGDLGRKAFRSLSLEVAKDEIVELVGKLNFRTSYTQNQWRHSIEAAHLAGLMAAELGLEIRVARRGALLHDIGKALTHELDGSHALIGADLARRSGELEAVANAIGYHHGEEPLGSAYAPLVAAADALSGGRPGARREMVEAYGDRIGDLERVANGFSGIVGVHAVQAGRELRVFVDEDRVSDAKLEELARDIAGKISDELVFPGQIRVTVIREFRAVETAN
ncbi:MAG: DUF3552 domain-containing protein [Deltaproteobacteria bacterium]|nr:DUF3552 domain-containing protein [Deltaproteobacteria bacterium]